MNFYQRSSSIPFTNDCQYLLNQTTNLPPRTSSWFRRPARVAKHASRDSSPRNLVRRRTTASVRAPSRQSSITDGRHHQKHFSTPNGIVSLEERGRPMSWHSTGLDQVEYQFLPSGLQFPSDVSSSHFLGPSFSTCEINGAITPISHPFAGEPFVQDAFTPLDEMSSQDFDRRYAFLNEFSADKDNFYGSQYGPQYPIPTDSHHQFPNGPYEVQRQPDHYFRQLEETAPPTPEIVPLQTSTGSIGDGFSDAADQAGADDLVGMGLYDAPSPMPASTSFLSGPWDLPIRPGLGKGLKLEETFQPTSTEDDEDEAASGEEGEEEECGTDQADGSMLPYLRLEDKRFYDEQNVSADSDFAADFTDQENTWWSTNAVTNHGWV
jgi:hypothetical protein